jgi:hypothetical protein
VELERSYVCVIVGAEPTLHKCFRSRNRTRLPSPSLV